MYFIVGEQGTVYGKDLSQLITSSSYMFTGKYVFFRVNYITGEVIVIEHKK